MLKQIKQSFEQIELKSINICSSSQKERMSKELSVNLIVKYLVEERCDQNLIGQIQSFFGEQERKYGYNDKSQNLQTSPSSLIETSMGTHDGDLNLKSLLQDHVKRSEHNYRKLMIGSIMKKSIESNYAESSSVIHQRSLDICNSDRLSDVLDGCKRGNALGWSQSKKILKTSELFQCYCAHLKTSFGHALQTTNAQDNEDPFIQVYNLIYDRNGELIITGDDMGLIKIWSSSSGLLLNSLKGHTMAINALEINNNNKYLASCSLDGFVILWHLMSGKPITAIQASNNNDAIQVLLFHQGLIDEFLIVASEKGNVYIHQLQSMLNNQGRVTQNINVAKVCVKSRPHYVKDRIMNTQNGILSIDMHPSGYLAAGTEMGDILIFDTIDNIYNPLDMQSIKLPQYFIWQEHTDNCHQLKWNKQGTRMISASFDGTARIWDWDQQSFHSNKQNHSTNILQYHEKDHLGKITGELKCWAVCWSCQGRYAIASFCRVLKRQDKHLPQIQVYDCTNQSLVHSFDQSVYKRMNSAHCLLDAHPYNENIALSADGEGLICLWDILKGYLIKVFLERGFHMRLPNLEMQILEGGWNPNGMNFAVSTAYGSYSIYGYGFQDLYQQVPVEQFYASDSEHPIINDTDGYFRILGLDHDQELYQIDRGSICNFYRLPYIAQLPQHYKDLQKLQSNTNKKGSVSKQINTNYWNSALHHESENNKNNQLFYNNYKELQDIYQEIQLNQEKQIQQSIQSNINDINIDQIENYWDIIQNSSVTVQSQLLSESQIKRVGIRRGRLQQQHLKQIKIRDGENEHEIYQPNDEISYSIIEEHNIPQPQPIQSRTRLQANRAIHDDDDDEDDNHHQQDQDDDDIYDNYSNFDSHENQQLQQIRTRASAKIQNREQQQQKRLRKQIEYPSQSEQESAYEPGHSEISKASQEIKEQDFSPPNNNNNNNVQRNTHTQRQRGTQGRNQQERLTRINQHRQQYQQQQISQLATQVFNGNHNNNTIIQLEPHTRKQRKQASQELICKRCKTQIKDMNQLINCVMCKGSYHEHCSQWRMILDDYNGGRCYNCLARSTHTRKQHLKNSLLSREYLDDPKSSIMIPQVGDLVMFFTQGYEEFLLKNISTLDLSKLYFQEQEKRFIIFPSDYDICDQKQCSQVLCTVLGIQYEFPCISNSRKAQQLQTNNNRVLIILYLSSEVGEFYCFYNATKPFYIIHKLIFDSYKQYKLHNNMKITFIDNNNQYLYLGTDSNDSFLQENTYNSLKFRDINDDQYATRGSRNNQNILKMNLWDIDSLDGTIVSQYHQIKQIYKYQECIKLAKEIQQLMKRNKRWSEYFMEQVDTNIYIDYLDFVTVMISVSTIINRLNKGFYRHKEQILQNIQQIQINANTYNPPTSEVALLANELCQQLTHLTEKNFNEQNNNNTTNINNINNNNNNSYNTNNNSNNTNNNNYHTSSIQLRNRPDKKYQESSDDLDDEEVKIDQLIQGRNTRVRNHNRSQRVNYNQFS